MKFLRLQAEGLPLFKEKIDMSFVASQRIMDDDKDKLYPLVSNVYLNLAEAIIGINASGKTSILKVILLALKLLGNQPINHIEAKEILGDTPKAIFNMYFYSSGEICRLETVISTVKKDNFDEKYCITGEKLWTKPAATIKTRKQLYDFEGIDPVSMRSGQEEFLPADVSIIIARNKRNDESLPVASMLSYTNWNVLPVSEEIPEAVIRFLDPTIEKLYFESKGNKSLVHLKFKEEEELVLENSRELENYLSSGTIKGIVTFTNAMKILKNGGYLLIDEIENHFNKEIVATLVRFFMNVRLNKNGAVLIYTTHYPEILDEYDRNDGIFITRNRNGITVENLASILTRNDIKKSDAYQSGFLEGTAPTYDAYMELKKNIAAGISEG